MSSSRPTREQQDAMHPLLLKLAIGVGTAVVAGLAAFFYSNRQRQQEEPHAYASSFTAASMPEEQMCGICLDRVAGKRPVRVLICGHMYHEHCIGTWLRTNNFCPMCKHQL